MAVVHLYDEDATIFRALQYDPPTPHRTPAVEAVASPRDARVPHALDNHRWRPLWGRFDGGFQGDEKGPVE